MTDRVGQQLDDYRLIRHLGKGTFGEVYLAEHVSRKTQFAVKILHARLDKDTFGDFLNEARAFRLDHPNIMRIRDFGIEDDITFLVMDYVPGGTLRRRYPHGARVPLNEIVSYVKQVSEALQYAHDEGLVHRDVKPENMLIGSKNEILLSDFGIVTRSYTLSPASTLGVVGTALYMAPEQIQAKPVRASDQYALSSIVYEWLVGFPPFRGTMTELSIQHLTVPPPSLRKIMPTISRDVEEVIMRGLAKDPKQRFPSIREFALALERASQAAPPLVIQSPYSTPSASLVSISSSIHSAITEEDTLVVPPASPPQQSQPVLGGATVPALDEWASQGMEPPAPVVSSTWAADTNAATIAGLASDAPAPAIGRVEHPAHLILRADNGEVLQEYVLEKLETSIGRAPNSDILLSRDRLASRRHATIRYENGNYILHDERSANGTFINGQLLEDDTPRILYDNDHIGIGEHEMTFRASRSPSSGVDIEGMPTIVVSSAASGMAYRTREGGLLNAAASDKCPFCGTETRSGDNFCLNCGNRLLPATPSSQQAQPVVGDATLPAVEEWALPVQKDWGGSLIGDVSMLTSPSVAFSGSNPPVLPLEERLVAESVFASPASPLVDEPVISSPPSSPVLAEPPPASSKHQTREQQLRKQRLEEGNAHYQAKRYEEALSMYEQLIALDPQDGLAHHSRGNALRKLKHFKEALGAYEQALAIISNDASIWIVKGQVLNSLRRYKEALTAYEQALALVPSNAVILTEKGEVLYKLERYTEALSACESSLALDSAIARTWTIKGNVLYRLERYEEALEAYDSALKMIHNIPKRASTFAAKGETFYKMERYDEALNAYDTACILKPQDATLANKRDMLRKLKRHKDQKEELEKSQLAVWSNMDIARLKQNEQPPSPVNSSPLISPKTADLQRTIIETRNPLERTLLFEHFDVFLSHLELDAQWVEQHLAMRLEDKERLRVWLDKWILIPGQPFQPARARGLDQARSCAVCIGEHNPNGWFEQEIQRAQNRQAKDPSFRVIPVLLPNAKDINLDNFLELKTVVDFRGSDPAYAFHLLVCGVKGIPPGRWSPEGSTITKPLTNAEDRLRELMQFRQSGLIDDTVALEYQRVVLEKIWLLSSSEPE